MIKTYEEFLKEASKEEFNKNWGSGRGVALTSEQIRKMDYYDRVSLLKDVKNQSIEESADGDSDTMYRRFTLKNGDIVEFRSVTHEWNEDGDFTEMLTDVFCYLADLPPIAILNTTILTADGEFSLKTISLEEAKKMIDGREILSAVGHQTTADILTELLEVEVPMNRIQFKQEAGQQALCFKLNGRPEEGKILSRDEIEKIGYEFKVLTMK